MGKIFDRLLEDKLYRELLDELPEDERKVVIEQLKEITERFETNLIDPLRKLKNST